MAASDYLVKDLVNQPSDVNIPEDLDLTNTVVAEAKRRDFPTDAQQIQQLDRMCSNDESRAQAKAILMSIERMRDEILAALK